MLNNTNDSVMKNECCSSDINEDDILREKARLSLKSFLDSWTASGKIYSPNEEWEEAWTKGWIEGFKLGRAQERARIAANLKAMGFSLSDIEDLIGTENTLQN